MRARERELRGAAAGELMEELIPVIQEGGSDSAMLDNALELLVRFGRDPLHALMMLVPEAYENDPAMDPDLVGFYRFHANLMEPWDGPAALVCSDGRYAVAALDRNGLRPQRFWMLADGTLIVGSEAGIVAAPAAEVVEKGRLGPGEMLAVDTLEGRLLRNAEIKRERAGRRPYRAWFERQRVAPPRPARDGWRAYAPAAGEDARAALRRRQRRFGYTRDEVERVLEPMAYDAAAPLGSMGDDTPLGVLSARPQLLYRHFKQRFAQVTNPPIDPHRERLVMSLETMVGPWRAVVDEREEVAHHVPFPSPVLAADELDWLLALDDPDLAAHTVEALFPAAAGPAGLAPAVERLCAEVEAALDRGRTLIVLSDRGADAERVPIPMLLATAAVHHHLIRARKRMQASLVCDTGEPREDHHFACLIGYGATLIHPWLAFESVAALAADDPRGTGLTARDAVARYRAAVDAGILKIMSKMGVSPVASYQGAQLFEAIGLAPAVIERWFPGTPSRVGGLDLPALAADALAFHAEAAAPDGGGDLPEVGIYRFRKEGEYHAFNPPVFKALHKARAQRQLHRLRRVRPAGRRAAALHPARPARVGPRRAPAARSPRWSPPPRSRAPSSPAR